VQQKEGDDDVVVIEESEKDIQARGEGLTTARSQKKSQKRGLSTFRSEQPKKRQRGSDHEDSLDKMLQMMVAREETKEKERIHQKRKKLTWEFQNKKSA